jgi:hypothetical protein
MQKPLRGQPRHAPTTKAETPDVVPTAPIEHSHRGVIPTAPIELPQRGVTPAAPIE